MADNKPLIIKRPKKAGGGGHHGGAWKVAYADFVTAMMAFFLLMWLLNATTEDERQRIANYFDDRIPISAVSGGGDGVFGGEAPDAADDKVEAPVSDATQDAPAARGDEGAADAEAFRRVEAAFEALSGEADDQNPLLRHVKTRVTEDGLVIDLFETPDGALFGPDGASPTPLLRALVDVMASIADLVTNDVAVSGHVRAGEAGDPWSLSVARAQTARRLLEGAGLGAGRMTAVEGRAGGEPLAADAADPRNARVEITLLRSPTRDLKLERPRPLGGEAGGGAAQSPAH